MASTYKTNKLGLNRWVGTDPVLMEDFNADNAIIDAKLGELAESCPAVKLGEMTVENVAKTITIDLSDVDLTKYHGLAAVLLGVTLSSSGSMRVHLHGTANNYSIDYQDKVKIAMFFWDKNGGSAAYQLFLHSDGPESIAHTLEGGPAVVDALEIIGNTNIVAGGKILLYGIL